MSLKQKKEIEGYRAVYIDLIPNRIWKMVGNMLERTGAGFRRGMEV